MNKYELDNGWFVYAEGGGYYVDVIGQEGSLFRRSRRVEIGEELFSVVAKGVRDYPTLAKEYGLYDSVVEWVPKEKMAGSSEVPPGRCLRGGWFVEEVGGEYFLEFITAAQGGRSIRHAISRSAYDRACAGTVDLKTLIAEYDL